MSAHNRGLTTRTQLRKGISVTMQLWLAGIAPYGCRFVLRPVHAGLAMHIDDTRSQNQGISDSLPSSLAIASIVCRRTQIASHLELVCPCARQ